jgi:hypothetical protein
MIVCTKCGFRNEDSDTFCGSCAGFLEWSGQQVVPEVHEPAPEPEPVLEEGHPGFIERVKDRIGIGDTREDEAGSNGVGEVAAVAAAPQPVAAGSAAPLAAAPAPPSAVAAPLLTAPAPPPPTTVAPVVTAEAPPTDVVAKEAPPAAAPTAPPPVVAAAPPAVAPTQPTVTAPVRTSPPEPPGATPPAAPAPVQPVAVKPVAARARPTPRAKVAPTRIVNPGDLICGQCGEGNDPARRFCRRCGASLQQAEVFTLPWYQRWWRKLTTRRTKVAGERPRMRRRAFGGAGPGWVTSWVTKLLAVAIIVFVVLCFVGPWKNTIRHHLSRYYHDVVNVVHTTYNPVHPLSAIATSAAPGHPPSLTIDGGTNTSWQTGTRGSAKGQKLVIKLAAATNIDKIGFLNGDSDSPGSFLTEPRLAVIQMAFGGTHPYTKTVTLKDEATFQSFTVKAKSATSLTITIESTYPSAQGTHAALAEVELFKKS